MVKAKVSYLPPEDSMKLKSTVTTTKQTMRRKLSSTDRRDMLATIYERTYSPATTPTSRSVSQKENANCGTNQRAVQTPDSSDGQNCHSGFPSQSVPGSLKNTPGAEDRPRKPVASGSGKSSPPLEKWNDGHERVGSSSNQKEGTQMISNPLDGQNVHMGSPSNRSVSRGLKSTHGAEDRLGKHVIPSGDRKSSSHPLTSRSSYNSGFSASSRSRKKNDNYERNNSSRYHKEERKSNSQVGENFRPGFSTARTVSGGSKNEYGREDRHQKQISPRLLKSRKSNDVCERVTEVPRKQLIRNDDPVDVIMPAKEARASSSRMEHPAHSCASSVPVKPLHTSNSGSCPSHHESQKRKSRDLLSDSLKYPRNGPAKKIIWKGAFEVLNLSHEMGFCEGFLAHPSAKVSAKAYKFSRQIAGLIQLKLDSRSELWPDLFRIRSPDWNDIALYFYPEKLERSRKKYSDLLHYMVKNDLVLKSLIGHVELLIFPSKSLALDCQQLMGNYFMWGVFRQVKGKTRS